MKRLLMTVVFAGAAVMLLATPPPNHKIPWCHFPPGLWNGSRANSTAIILDIDVSADGIPTDGQHLNHLGDGPASTLGNDCKGTVTSDG